MDDTPNKVLESVVRDLGGSKLVAPLLWPEKGVEEARRLLCDCLNDDRPAKLDFAHVIFILRLARQRGIHTGMQYLCAELSYADPQPIEPKDEIADLIRQYLTRREQEAASNTRLERMLEQHLRVRAAA